MKFLGYDFRLEAAARRGRPSLKAPGRSSEEYPMMVRRQYKGAKPENLALPKRTPYTLRAMSRTPVFRRGLNVVKDSVLGRDWVVRTRDGVVETTEHLDQIRIVRNTIELPNTKESGHKLMSAHLEDLLVGGWGPMETQSNGDPDHPWWMWTTDGPSIEINPFWNGSPSDIRYIQRIPALSRVNYFSDAEMFYVVPNPNTYSPYGLSPGEIVFDTMNAFFAAYKAIHKREANTMPQAILHIGEGSTPDEVAEMENWWREDVEGSGEVAFMGGTDEPKMLPIFTQPPNLKWLELQIIITAGGFGISGGKMGLNKDVNRSTKDGQMQEDDDTSIDPWAKLIADEWTFHLIRKRFGFKDIIFTYDDYEVAEEAARSEILERDWNSNLITLDEYRQGRHYGPVGDGRGTLRRYELEKLGSFLAP